MNELPKPLLLTPWMYEVTSKHEDTTQLHLTLLNQIKQQGLSGKYVP